MTIVFIKALIKWFIHGYWGLTLVTFKLFLIVLMDREYHLKNGASSKCSDNQKSICVKKH